MQSNTYLKVRNCQIWQSGTEASEIRGNLGVELKFNHIQQYLLSYAVLWRRKHEPRLPQPAISPILRRLLWRIRRLSHSRGYFSSHPTFIRRIRDFKSHGNISFSFPRYRGPPGDTKFGQHQLDAASFQLVGKSSGIPFARSHGIPPFPHFNCPDIPSLGRFDADSSTRVNYSTLQKTVRLCQIFMS